MRFKGSIKLLGAFEHSGICQIILILFSLTYNLTLKTNKLEVCLKLVFNVKLKLVFDDLSLQIRAIRLYEKIDNRITYEDR